jgi:Chaperone of endosialidase
MIRFFQILSSLLFVLILNPASAQVAIGTGSTAPNPNPNAVLLLVGNGTNQGLIIPSVTSLSGFGSAGMVVYNSTSNTVHYHNGTAWNQVGAAGSGTQGIQISGNTVSLTATPNAGFGLSSPAPTATGQLLVWNGTGWESTPAPTTNGQTLSWNQTTDKWTIGAGATVATLSGDVSGASNSTTISNTAGNNIATAINNAATTNRILESRITPSGTNNQVLTTVGGVAQWANATGGVLPSLSANQLLSNNGSNTGINVSGDLGLSVAGTTGTFTIANNAINTAKIDNGAVTVAKIGTAGLPDANRVLTTDASGVPQWTIAAGGGDMLQSTYDPTNINGSAFNLSNHTGQISTNQISDGNVTNVKLASGIDAAKVNTGTLPGTVLPANVLLNSSTAGGELSGTLSNLAINNNAITTTKILDGNVTTAKLANDAVDATKIANGAVGLTQLANGPANNVLTTNASGVPQWSIAAGGDMTKSIYDPTNINGSAFNLSNHTGQISTTQIADATVTNAKLDKSAIPLSGFAAPTAAVDFGGQRITNLAAPTAATDATTKAYVDLADATKLNATILTTQGDILYNNGSATTRLPRGSLGEVLQSTATGIQWAPGGSGETNTASNVGVGGVGIFRQKTGVNLELRNINAASNRIGVALDAPNNEIDIDVNQANLTIATSQITGQLSVANGGTGVSTLPANAVLLGNGAGSIGSVTGGSPTNVLTLNASNIPVWQPVPGGVSAVSGSGPITVANGTSTPAISITQANASTPGFLSASDFSAFNAKQNALTFGDVTSANAALTVTGGTGAAVGGNVSLNLNTGTGANQLVQLNSSGQLPAVDGSQLTGLPGGGDINGVDTPVGGGLTGGLLSGTPSLRLINGSATGQVLKWDNPTTSWVIGTDDVGGGALPTLSDAQVIISVGANNPQGRVLQQDISVASASGNVTVQGLRGTPISATAPAANQVLKFNAGTYSPAADNDSQNLSVGGTGTVATGETFPLAISSGTGINIIEGTNVQIDRTGSNLTINTSGGGAPTGPATGDLAGSYPAPSINTSSATTGSNIITAINTATTGTINTARLNTGVVLDTESPVAGDITGTYGTGFQIGAGTIAGTDLTSNITISTTGTITGANVIGNGSGLTSLNAGNISTGTLPVARGGSGITAVTPGGVAFGGATNFAFTSAGTSGQLLQSNGASAPTWVNAPSNFTTLNTVPKGSAGGLIASSIFDDGTYTGIGRTTPIGSSRFDIQATGFGANGYGGMYIQTDNTGWPFYGYSNNGGTSMWTYWNGGTGTWNVYNNGDQLSVTNTGNVGIGTTTPTQRLDISGGIRFSGALMPNNLPGTSGQVLTSAGAGVPPTWVTPSSLGTGTINRLTYWNSSSTVAAGSNLAWDNAGENLGIGWGAPERNLHLHRAAAAETYAKFTNTSTTIGAGNGFEIGINATPGDVLLRNYENTSMQFLTNNTERLRITAAGNVGIGTNNPQATTHTFGTSNISSINESSNTVGTWQVLSNTSAGGRIFSMISTGSANAGGPGKLLISSNSAFGTTTANIMAFDHATANVGIGTLAPSERLEVNGGIFVNGASPTNLLRFAQAGFDFPTFTSRSIGTKVVLWPAMSGASTDFAIGVGLGTTWYSVPSATSSQMHRFYAGTTELMQIRGDGNVGIGTTAPNAPLQFSNSIVNRKIVLYDVNNNDHQYYGFGINGGTLRYQVDATAANHVFYAGASTTTSNELMRITGTGRVGIGTASPSTQGRLHVSGGDISVDGTDADGIKWVNGNTLLAHMHRFGASNNALYVTNAGTSNLTGVFLASGATSWTSTSDRRLKENIVETSYGLNEILRLSVKEYNLKTTQEKDKKIGFLAQEVYKVIPEIVQKGDDGEYGGSGNSKELEKSGFTPWGLDYTSLVPILVKGMQDQQRLIEALKKENSELKGANTQLKTEVSAMKEKQDTEITSLKKQMEEVLRIVGAEAKKD